jgi:hypothetical protein
VVAQPYTTTLIVRGPAVTDRFLVTDRHTGHSWWQYGASSENPDEAARKQMTAERARQCVTHLIDERILP